LRRLARVFEEINVNSRTLENLTQQLSSPHPKWLNKTSSLTNFCLNCLREKQSRSSMPTMTQKFTSISMLLILALRFWSVIINIIIIASNYNLNFVSLLQRVAATIVGAIVAARKHIWRVDVICALSDSLVPISSVVSAVQNIPMIILGN
jgi:hypothetical protein